MPTASCGFPSRPDFLLDSGPTLGVQIGFDASFRPDGPPPSLEPSVYWALIDTGAVESCIDSGLALRLGLPVVDRRLMSGVGGPGEFNVHVAQIHVPILSFTIYGRFAGVHLSAGGQSHEALLGRTFLQHFLLHYDGRTGEVTVSND